MVHKDDEVCQGSKIYGSRLVHELKGKGMPEVHEKSRLAIQCYQDSEKW